MDKVVTTRKDHDCAYCLKVIPRGSKAYYTEGRDPVFETDRIDAIMGQDGKQVGIEYWKVYYCTKKGVWPSCAQELYKDTPQ